MASLEIAPKEINRTGTCLYTQTKPGTMTPPGNTSKRENSLHNPGSSAHLLCPLLKGMQGRGKVCIGFRPPIIFIHWVSWGLCSQWQSLPTLTHRRPESPKNRFSFKRSKAIPAHGLNPHPYELFHLQESNYMHH